MKEWQSKPAVWGLASVWGVAEAGLGGIMHGLKLPFTGLTVGGVAAAVLIALSAHERGLYHPQQTGTRSTLLLLKVTGTVLLIKALASPHSPVTAYVAVAFQGLIATVLFRIIPSFRLAALAFSVLAMAESAAQKFLMLLLVYGHAFVDALDALTGYASGQIQALGWDVALDGTFLLALFIGVYVAWGAILGWTVGGWPSRAQFISTQIEEDWKRFGASMPIRPPQKKRFQKHLLLVSMLIILAVAGATASELGWLIARTIAITALLFGVLGPLTRKLLTNYASPEKTSQALGIISTFDEQRRRFVWAFQSARRHYPAWKVPLSGLERWMLLNIINPPHAR